MNLDVITKILEDAHVGVLGTTLFQDHLPDAAATGCMVRLPVDGVLMSGYVPGFFTSGRIQVICRSPSYDAGKALADRVFAVLTISQRMQFNDHQGNMSMIIHAMRPLSLPIVYARTPGNLTEWSVNFAASYVMALPA